MCWFRKKLIPKLTYEQELDCVKTIIAVNVPEMISPTISPTLFRLDRDDLAKKIVDTLHDPKTAELYTTTTTPDK